MPPKEADYAATIQYVAAEPGYDVLLYVPDGKTYERHPVVSWAILHGDEDFICAQPITLMSWSINDDRCVEMPSGEVVCDDRVWPNAEVWLAEMKTNNGVPLAADAVDKPARAPDVALSDRPGTVLALNNFRDRFRSEQ